MPDPSHEAAPVAASVAALVPVIALFLVWGFVTSVIDGLAPAVRAIFRLSYTEQMLTQFAFFLAYGAMSLPAAALLAYAGAADAIMLALSVMVLGCLTAMAGATVDSYPVILLALFVIASGITLLQVAANPLSATLGDPRHAPFRLTLSQGFNSLGTVLGPLVASLLLLQGGLFATGDAARLTPLARAVSLRGIAHQFGLIAVLVLVLGIFVWPVRARLQATQIGQRADGGLLSAFRSGWGLFGAFAIFLYVGSEVGASTIMVNFLAQPVILGITPARAAQLLGIVFWGGAMLGRFLASPLLRVVPAAPVLGMFAVVGILLCLFVTQSLGPPAAVAALALGVFNSVMFPTIFTLTLARSAASAASVSGLLCTAIVGGAFVPPLVGLVADTVGLSAAFVVPLVGYVGIAMFAIFERTGNAATTVETAAAPS